MSKSKAKDISLKKGLSKKEKKYTSNEYSTVNCFNNLNIPQNEGNENVDVMVKMKENKLRLSNYIKTKFSDWDGEKLTIPNIYKNRKPSPLNRMIDGMKTYFFGENGKITQKSSTLRNIYREEKHQKMKKAKRISNLMAFMANKIDFCPILNKIKMEDLAKDIPPDERKDFVKKTGVTLKKPKPKMKILDKLKKVAEENYNIRDIDDFWKMTESNRHNNCADKEENKNGDEIKNSLNILNSFNEANTLSHDNDPSKEEVAKMENLKTVSTINYNTIENTQLNTVTHYDNNEHLQTVSINNFNPNNSNTNFHPNNSNTIYSNNRYSNRSSNGNLNNYKNIKIHNKFSSQPNLDTVMLNNLNLHGSIDPKRLRNNKQKNLSGISQHSTFNKNNFNKTYFKTPPSNLNTLSNFNNTFQLGNSSLKIKTRMTIDIKYKEINKKCCRIEEEFMHKIEKFNSMQILSPKKRNQRKITDEFDQIVLDELNNNIIKNKKRIKAAPGGGLSIIKVKGGLNNIDANKAGLINLTDKISKMNPETAFYYADKLAKEYGKNAVNAEVDEVGRFKKNFKYDVNKEVGQKMRENSFKMRKLFNNILEKKRKINSMFNNRLEYK